MITTKKLLKMIQQRNNNCSEYQAAKLLEIMPAAVYRWTANKSHMSDETAIKAAILCGLDADYVVACIAAERAKGTNAFTTWQHIAHRLEPSNLAA